MTHHPLCRAPHEPSCPCLVLFDVFEPPETDLTPQQLLDVAQKFRAEMLTRFNDLQRAASDVHAYVQLAETVIRDAERQVTH